MRHTNTDFLNALVNTPAPVYVRFDASPVGGSLVVRDQSGYVVNIDVPANYDFTNGFVSSPTTDLLDRLTELKKKYSTVWLPNSTRPTDDAFQNAKDFVSTLPLNRIVKPSIHIASDGEVNFQWAGPDFHIDLGFYGNGKFSFYGAKKGHEPITGDEVPVKDGIPEDLAKFAAAV
jgi:hypothetical protein